MDYHCELNWKSFARRLILLVLLVVTLNGCIATIAPTYDRELVEGVTTTNPKLLEFFASISEGTSRTTYSQREARYDSLIGQFEAFEIQSRSRPIPSGRAVEKANSILDKRGISAIVGETPSASALGKVSETLMKMRETDKKQGITETEVKAFKNQIIVYLDQILTYENFLNR